MALLDEVIDRHGGRERWAAAKRLRAHIESGGLLLRTRVPGRKLEGEIEVELHEPVSRFRPFPAPGSSGVFDHGAVRIETDDGEVLESREHPRELFFGATGVRRNLRWDALDLCYFAGYAWWNYIAAPFLLEEPGVEVDEIEPWRAGANGDVWRRLAVTFPPEIHTHSPEQVFYFDDQLHLRRHDYTAQIVGRSAHAAHMCADHVEAGGLLFPTRRWVRPIGPRNRAMPGPTLVALRVSEISLDMTAEKPILWHIPVSHYSEKARWALAHKRVDHERRAPMPGAHMAIAGFLTRGQSKTFPVLQVNGRSLGDSTAIIAELERTHPGAPLYPEDPEQRQRALDLEEYFDENLGPEVRLLVWHELRRDPERMADLSEQMIPGPLKKLPNARGVGRTFSNAFTQLRYRVSTDTAAEKARATVLASLDRLEAELEASDGNYLVGDEFTVADLTAAALFYPLVNPIEGPHMIGDFPPPLEDFIAPLRARPGYAYVERMFRKHRN